jgi:nucleoid DNA-binding protein
LSAALAATGGAMTYRELIATIARHLPHQTQRDVAEILDLLIEVWYEELTQGNTVSLPDIGRLSIEIQSLHVSGIVQQKLGTDAPQIIPRLYGRFRPAKALKEERIRYEQTR